MILALSLAIAVLLGTGASLLVSRDLLRVVAGSLVISNAASLYVFATGQSRGVAPILPVASGKVVSDPLVQALTLTAIVISFGITTLLLALAYRLHEAHGSADLQDIAEAEMEDEAALGDEEV